MSTQTLDAVSCRTQVAALLDEEERQLGRLATLLDHEFEAIQSNDLDALDDRGAARTQAMSGLSKIQDERRGLLTLLRYPASNDGLEQLLRWCDPAHGLLANWQRCALLAARCRELNERNGLAVNARLRRVEGMLEVITARPPANTYDRDAGPARGDAGRLLRAEA